MLRANIQATAVSVALLFSGALWGFGQEPATREFKPRVLMRPLRPIVDAPTIGANDATDDVVKANELVLGVSVNGESRAYPINMLCGPSREIINDTLGGRSIAATW